MMERSRVLPNGGGLVCHVLQDLFKLEKYMSLQLEQVFVHRHAHCLQCATLINAVSIMTTPESNPHRQVVRAVWNTSCCTVACLQVIVRALGRCLTMCLLQIIEGTYG